LVSTNSSCIAFEITWSLYLTYIFFNIFFIYLLTKFLLAHLPAFLFYHFPCHSLGVFSVSG
jgi:hypothetical protein